MPVGQGQRPAVQVDEIYHVVGDFDQLFGSPVGETQEEVLARHFTQPSIGTEQRKKSPRNPPAASECRPGSF